MKSSRYLVQCAAVLPMLSVVGCASMDVTTLVSPNHHREIDQLTLLRMTVREAPVAEEPAVPDDVESATESPDSAVLAGVVR